MKNHLGKVVVPDDDGWITTQIEVELSEVIDSEGLEEFLDLISERATGNENSCLMQQSYRVVKVTATGTLVLEVKGDASMDLDIEET